MVFFLIISCKPVLYKRFPMEYTEIISEKVCYGKDLPMPYTITKEAIEAAVIGYEPANSSKFKLPSKVSEKQLQNAINRYAKGLRTDQVVALMDTTLFDNGKNGYLLTETHLYSSGKGPGPIPLADLVSVIQNPDILEDDLIFTYKDGHTVAMWVGVYSADFLALFDLMINFTPGQRTPPPSIEDFSEEMILYAVERYDPTCTFYFQPTKDVKPSQVAGAIRKYARGVLPRQVVALMDTTIFDSGKTGFLLTETHLYGNGFHEPVALSGLTEIGRLDNDLTFFYADGSSHTQFMNIYCEDMEKLFHLLFRLRDGAPEPVPAPEPEPAPLPKPEPTLPPKPEPVFIDEPKPAPEPVFTAKPKPAPKAPESPAGPPQPVYEGPAPYIFVSYAHEDRQQVYPIIRALMDQGYRVWYDEGVQCDSNWIEFVAGRLSTCTVMVAFLSQHYYASDNCKQELYFAQDENIPYTAAYLDDAKPPVAIRLRLKGQFTMSLHQFLNLQSFLEKLTQTQTFRSCLTDSPPVPKPDPHTCPQCGARNIHSRFCPECGTKLPT